MEICTAVVDRVALLTSNEEVTVLVPRMGRKKGLDNLTQPTSVETDGRLVPIVVQYQAVRYCAVCVLVSSSPKLIQWLIQVRDVTEYECSYLQSGGSPSSF